MYSSLQRSWSRLWLLLATFDNPAKEVIVWDRLARSQIGKYLAAFHGVALSIHPYFVLLSAPSLLATLSFFFCFTFVYLCCTLGKETACSLTLSSIFCQLTFPLSHVVINLKHEKIIFKLWFGCKVVAWFLNLFATAAFKEASKKKDPCQLIIFSSHWSPDFFFRLKLHNSCKNHFLTLYWCYLTNLFEKFWL